MYLFTHTFWAYSFERIIKTFVQTLLAAITVSAFQIANGQHWLTALANAGVAAFISLLTAITAYSAASGTESTPASTLKKDEQIATVEPSESVTLFTAS